MPDAFTTRLAATLRRTRRERGLTQAEVAERAGVAVEVYGRIERGAAMPRADTVARLAASLGLTGDELLGLAPAGQHAAEDEARYAKDELRFRPLLRRLRHTSPRTVRMLSELLGSLERDARRRR